jgi:hypothetical protein
MSHDMFPYDDPLDELEQAIVDEAMKNGGRIKFRTLEEILTPNKEIMKAKCIKQYKQLEGILDKGDIVEIETIKTEKDEIVMKWKDMGRRDKRNNVILDEVPDHIIPTGTYKDYHFKSKNGEHYSGGCLDIFIGPRPMSEIFKKI